MPVQISSASDFEAALSGSDIVVTHFAADWCAPCKDLDAALDALAQEFPAKYLRVDAEQVPAVAEKYNVESVPFVVLFKGGQVKGQVAGAKLPEIRALLVGAGAQASAVPLEERLKRLVNQSPVMVFMKGQPAAPRCGFSNQIVGILNETGVPFGSFDILSDEEVRQGLKTFSNWPTYPQLYVNGELVGGLDIVKELQKNGELVDTLKGKQ
eukprot:TRINITY_DN100178_c0_g1_i1.p1 TRINITY_DN100178_c0_g1~~TRINITY_DN100178_c0_g1_i1.p1  ORF type:complete len:219 (-),score=47.48 TRINITY_DN100178_c0_g1_i1:37-669(-)